MMIETSPLVFVAIATVVVILLFVTQRRGKRVAELEQTTNELDGRIRQLLSERDACAREIRLITDHANGLKRLIEEKGRHFPWLATAFGDYEELRGRTLEAELLEKKHPAPKAAESVREAKARAKKAEKMFRLLKYRIDFLEKYFPWLSEVTGESLEEILAQSDDMVSTHDEVPADPVINFLSSQEYEVLTQVERNQLALDRWLDSKKSNWQIGRMYERFVGYELEQQGFKVDYFGAIEGYDDLGRDLIATNSGKVEILQCKYWSREKTIHEKHVFQIFGTVVEYVVGINASPLTLSLFDTFEKFSDIRPVLVTSTTLSERARKFADILSVEVRENVPLRKYPLIKCNVSRASSERVYHLPFDQQYDKTAIEPERGEFYAWTTAEAEKAGFRRAYRWRPAGVA